MSDTYLERLEEIFCNIHEDIMSNLFENDKEYSKLVTNNANQSTKIMEIYNLLNDEDMKFISDNKDCIGKIQWIERQQLYFQGYKDCIKLLKSLDIIK